MPDASKRELLRVRSAMLARVRHFFQQRQIIEADCPILCQAPAVDRHIDAIAAQLPRRYLFSSPEYGMKRLLAADSGDLYFLGHVFRQGEWGALHNPEFTLIEWYRIGFSLPQLIEETLALCNLFLQPPLAAQIISYRQLFCQQTGLDPWKTPVAAWQQWLAQQLPTVELGESGSDIDTLLQTVMTLWIEPRLPRQQLTVVKEYPPQQAALAVTCWQEGQQVALRFEVYAQGVELANGFCELGDATEQRQRFLSENAQRQQLGKECYPLDERFLAALERLPPCAGVAVGFDRLLMLKLGARSIAEVLPFPWSEA